MNTFLKTQIAALALASVAVGCTTASPKVDNNMKDAVDKKVEDTKADVAKAATVALPEQSCVKWVGTKKSGKHEGGFAKCTGTLNLSDKGTLSGVTVNVDLSSVYSDAEQLTGHLKTADFFDVATFATATFTSSAVRVVDAAAGSYEIDGEFNLHGVKKTETVKATFTQKDGKLVGVANVPMLRSAFNIAYAGKEEDPINDEVPVVVTLEAPASVEAAATKEPAATAPAPASPETAPAP